MNWITQIVLAVLVIAASAPAADSKSLTNEEIRSAYYKSYTYERMQDYENAVRALAPVVEAYPNAYTVNLRLGWLYYLKLNYANSIQHYVKAVKSAPLAVEAKLSYSLPLMAQEKYADAETVLNQVILSDHYNYYANLRLAMIYRLQGRWELAEKVSVKMLTLLPTDVAFLTEWALVKSAQGDTAGAMAAFNDVLILDPENPTAKKYAK